MSDALYLFACEPIYAKTTRLNLLKLKTGACAKNIEL